VDPEDELDEELFDDLIGLEPVDESGNLDED